MKLLLLVTSFLISISAFAGDIPVGKYVCSKDGSSALTSTVFVGKLSVGGMIMPIVEFQMAYGKTVKGLATIEEQDGTMTLTVSSGTDNLSGLNGPYKSRSKSFPILFQKDGKIYDLFNASQCVKQQAE